MPWMLVATSPAMSSYTWRYSIQFVVTSLICHYINDRKTIVTVSMTTSSSGRSEFIAAGREWQEIGSARRILIVTEISCSILAMAVQAGAASATAGAHGIEEPIKFNQ
jgi:hypothetical protein